jgi:acetolactate synthase-1/2/3 large subunit
MAQVNAQINGGHALMHALDRAGVRLVLGVPGVGQYEAVDAFYQHPRIRYLSLRHEQAASYMADGYARVSGTLAAILLVPGPGLLNATAGIATAHACSSPMLVITGTDRQYGHSAHEVSPVLQSLTKWSARATTHGEIASLVQEAVRQAMSGRPRPVGLEVPHTVLAEMGAWEEATPADPSFATVGAVSNRPSLLDPSLLAQAATLLAAAQHPLIWAGGGVMRSGAWEEVHTLAERWRAPVITTRSGKGALSDRHPLALGFAEARYAPLQARINGADVIVAVGVSQNLGKRPAKLIRIDIDPDVAAGASGVQLVGDARTLLRALLAATGDLAPHRPHVEAPRIEAEVAALNRARFDPTQQLQPQWALMAAMRAALPDDAVVVQGMNQMGYYSRNYWPTYAPRAYLTSSSLATLGAAWPLALGATLGVQDHPPPRPVVALCGDGGFLYNVQELATAVQHGLPTTVVVFNDNAYGNVLRAQQEQFDGRVVGTQLHNPDFVQLAHAFGAWGVRAQGAAELGDALRAAQQQSGPALIEVPVGPMKRVY